MDTLSREATLSNFFLSSTQKEKESTQKEKKMLPNGTLSKGVYSKRKEFAPHWSKFFPFRVEYFSERGLSMKVNRKSLKLSPLSKMAGKVPVVSIHLK